MKLSIIIPVYNEEKTIILLLKNLLKISIPGYQKEIIIVNDGSTDKTKSLIKNFLIKRRDIILINEKKNKGKGTAVKIGLNRASGDLMLIQDADLEYPPSNIPLLLKALNEKNLEIVYGSRRLNKKNKYSSHLYFFGGVFINTIITLITRKKITDSISGTKLFTKRVLAKIKPIEAKGFDIDVEITAKAVKKGFEIAEIPIKYFPRTHSQGKKIRWYHIFKIIKTLIKHTL